MPILILFGGSGRNEIVNDIWMLSTDKSPFKWEKVNINGTYPIPKVYHTANLYKVANQPEMMIIYGGRGGDNISHSEVVGLRRSTIRTNEWEWQDFPRNKNDNVTPIGRHQVIYFKLNNLHFSIVLHSLDLFFLSSEVASAKKKTPHSTYIQL